MAQSFTSLSLAGFSPAGLAKQPPRWLGVLLATMACTGCKKTEITHTSSALSIAASGPNVTATPTDGGGLKVDFGDVFLGATSTAVLTAASVTGVSVDLTAITPASAPPFTLSFPIAPVDLTAVGSATFSPTAVGPQSTAFTIDTNDVDSRGNKLTVGIAVTGNGVLGQLTASPNPLDFGATLITHPVAVPIGVTNNTAAPVTLFISPVTAGTFGDGGSSPAFTVDPPPAAAIAPGATAQVMAHFAPTELGGGELTASVNFQACAGCQDGATVVLKGSAQRSALCVDSPVSIGFVQLGQAASASVRVRNCSAAYTVGAVQQPVLTADPAITLGNASWADGGGVVQFPTPLAPGQELDLPVTLTPTSLTEYVGTLAIYSDDPGDGDLPVTLIGYGGGGHLSCTPTSLQFGPVIVTLGNSVSQLVTCSNDGTDIPGHPEAALIFGPGSGLEINVPANDAGSAADGGPFSAAFVGLPPDAGLTAGQRLYVAAAFEPGALGGAQGQLSIRSNDVARSPTKIQLAGQGLAAAPCNVTATPNPLAFGALLANSQQAEQFVVSNVGSTPCVVQNFALAAGSAPAFAISGAPSVQQLSFNGDLDNPSNNPLSLPVTVTVDVPDSGTLAGAATFQVVDGTPATVNVPLSASVLPGCFQVTPPDVDFGSVSQDPVTGKWCSTGFHVFSASNACSQPVRVESFALDDGALAGPQFTLSGEPLSRPYTVPGGGFFKFDVAFTPTELGEKLQALDIQTDEFSAPYRITLRGRAGLGTPHTDTFAIAPTQVDVVWAWELDSSLAVLRSILAAVVPVFNAAAADGFDLHLATLSTDSCAYTAAAGALPIPLTLPDAGSYAPFSKSYNGPVAPFVSDYGWFEPCAHCYDQTSAAAQIITTASTRPGDDFAALSGTIFQAATNLFPNRSFVGLNVPLGFAPGEVAEQASLSPCGWLALNGVPLPTYFVDTFLDAALLAIAPDADPALLPFLSSAAHNVGFRRPATKLVVLWAKGDNNDDLSSQQIDYVNQLQTASPNLKLAAAGVGSQLGRVTQSFLARTSGLYVAVDAPQAAEQLKNLLSSIVAQSFPLSGQPVVDTLEVSINGARVGAVTNGLTNWSYDPVENALTISASYPVGTSVVATYLEGCSL